MIDLVGLEARVTKKEKEQMKHQCHHAFALVRLLLLVVFCLFVRPLFLQNDSRRKQTQQKQTNNQKKQKIESTRAKTRG